MIKDKNYFGSLIGEQLSSVEFVQDYLQLHFDGNDITFYLWPTIDNNGVKSVYNDINYKNELCRLIGKEIVLVSFDDKTEFSVTFINGIKVVVCLTRNELNKNLKELLYYKDNNNNWLVLD